MVGRKKNGYLVEAKASRTRSSGSSLIKEGNPSTVALELMTSIRDAGAFTTGDQTPPAAILWTDGEGRWSSIISELKQRMPELYSLGSLDPAQRSGPAIWLRCVEARVVEPHLPEGQAPVFYLPGISRQDLRAVEDCTYEHEPLVELQFRGSVWSHPNGRDWTPTAFLSSAHGGLNLDLASDVDTAEALERSLPALLDEALDSLQMERLDAEFLNQLLNPDLPLEVVRWMNDAKAARLKKSDAAWEAFCSQCVHEYKFNPEKDGPLRAAELLGNRSGQWDKVWARFSEAPSRYAGVVGWLEKAAPPQDGELPLNREFWPTHNAGQEFALAKALLGLRDVHPGEAADRIVELEKKHGTRRDWLWREVGRSPLAVALEHLSLLAIQCRKPLAGPDAASMAAQYVEQGWEVDAAALRALAGAYSPDTEEPITTAVRSVYLNWLDQSARNLQAAVAGKPDAVAPTNKGAETADGRVLLFVDGLRLDVARWLRARLEGLGAQIEMGWDWSAFPSVTSTCKPAVSPMADALTGGGPEEGFAPLLEGTTQSWTVDRLKIYLAEKDVQWLSGRETGDPGGSAWTEVGSIDQRGHSEGIKSAALMQDEVKQVAARVKALLDAGWKEVVVLTDHGWLLMPGGLPKVELSHHVVEHRWGRCASIKSNSSPDALSLPWYWNPAVTIATPAGAGCFRAGITYSHGGLSVQEMVIPRMTVRAGAGTASGAKISGVKWLGMRCRVTVQGGKAGMKVDVRGRPADAASSKVEGGKPREIGTDGTVSLPVSDDRAEGAAAVVVLLSVQGEPVHSMPVVIGENT